MALNSPRLVLKNVYVESQLEGEGKIVREGTGSLLVSLVASYPQKRVGFGPFSDAISHIRVIDYAVSPPGGFTDHPHRGFETVTYVLQGAIAYEDFLGNKSTIRTGDVQWMTAGRGIIHSEMAGGEGTNTAVQLWLNLSSNEKMIEPRCLEVLSDDIPTAEQDGVEVRILAGEALGVHSPVYNQTPIMFLDFTLQPGAQLHQCIPESWNSFVYVIEGEGIFGSLSSPPRTTHNLLVLGHGDGLSVWNNTFMPLRFLLMGGQPLNEPVVQFGPFVMNTQSEIEKTRADYRHFKNGFEMGKHWRSQQ